MSSLKTSWSSPYKILIVLLIVGFVHGSVYVILLPPWQHYDEPNHFEYAWLIAKKGDLPEPGEYDQQMRRRVARSMIDNGFFKRLNFLPSLETNGEPIWIGYYSQLTNPPFYYILASLPMRFLPIYRVTLLLYVARLVSLALFLLTILAAWGIISELTPVGHPLRWGIPLSIALLPGFVDLMTAVNNDVGAISIFSLALWGCIRLIRRGFSLLLFGGTAVLVGLCFWTKETAYVIFPVFIISIIFAIFRGPIRRAAWAIVTLLVVIGLLVTLTWGDAALWYRSTSQAVPTRVASEKAVLGRHAFQIKAGAAVTPSWLVPLFQLAPELNGGDSGQQVFTLGAWMWADHPAEAQTPVLSDGRDSFFVTVPISQKPVFHAFKVTLPEDPLNRVSVSLPTFYSPAEEHNCVYYDGLILADGERPLDQPPTFSNTDGAVGDWGGRPFHNYLRNASAERAGLSVRHSVDEISSRFLPDESRASLLLTYLLDWQGAGWFYKMTADRLLKTFWGFFAWGSVPLLGSLTYPILTTVTFVGLAGGPLALFRHKGGRAWDAFVVLGLALAAIWILTFVRGAMFITSQHPYLPVARYVYSAIIPTALLWCAGWLAWFRVGEERLKLPPGLKAAAFVLFFLGLDLLAIASILHYYRS